ncbi:hypothetical protein [Streptomyces sp. CNQ085]|uniref:hypothetical protein n=1 Tax=Streptomyces sp. CNQ085 TaxID=2886944 RepID=UPI001F50DBD2|nr:hypothetical protein [Streptomyces sp. CNQ085]MCI0385918.1 hypothetical protein [Streptomyces sp. CNQ085]
MSQTQTQTSSETSAAAGEHHGRHRGPAAVGEEPSVPVRGRHRRTAGQEPREE